MNKNLSAKIKRIKVVRAGQACPKCGTAVEKRAHAAHEKKHLQKAYWFAWWFVCPQCRASYMVEAAKRFRATQPTQQIEMELGK